MRRSKSVCTEAKSALVARRCTGGVYALHASVIIAISVGSDISMVNVCCCLWDIRMGDNQFVIFSYDSIVN